MLLQCIEISVSIDNTRFFVILLTLHQFQIIHKKISQQGL